jgi:predicted nucleic acid-binding protein
MSNILVDTCFWYALFDARDPDHYKANDLATYLDFGNVILPYPILYETINTRFTRNKSWLEEFDKILKKDHVQIIDDLEYRSNALTLTIDSTLIRDRPLSLVDMVIRLMLEDVNLNVDVLMSFNTGDFIDICHKMRIELINE